MSARWSTLRSPAPPVLLPLPPDRTIRVNRPHDRPEQAPPMTAPTWLGDDDDDLTTTTDPAVARLADELFRIDTDPDHPGGLAGRSYEDVAAALLPALRRLADEEPR